VRERIDDLTDERERRRLGGRIEDRARRIRHEQHVRLGNALPPANRGTVEAESFVEGGLVERAQRQRHVLPGAEQVAELQVDHRDARLSGPLEGLARVRQRLASVRQVVLLVLDFRHLCLLRVGPQKKRPQLELSCEAP
jgi:hypothetical protein